ncbi:MAG: Crp/Fnr family transcriptional regulator [Polyangiaceae bacterium]|nr:Crp/Fnr family transcriptional regulator [Myxococcales bacterium]MCB9585925.1 Crp/Fnr family transcriptional regulator [Polyangiaceae bacterium]MCB9607145.1 Crp/Fnr family transcriptional regulator [Polyangiaceae bacterium]
MAQYANPFEHHIQLSPEELSSLAAFISPISYQAGATLFPHGEICRDLIILQSGLVRVYYLHDAREVNLRLLCAPAVATALSSLITEEPAEEWVEAVSEVSGFRLRLCDFEAAHAGGLVERLRRALAEQHYLSMERRLRTLQWKSAEERYAYFVRHMESDIVQRMPGYHVASYLGVTPESLSRVRNKRRAGS